MSDFNQNVAKILMEKIQAEIRKETEGHDQVVNENGDQIWAPNHYCVHHGGVHHNGKIEMAEAVGHNFNEKEGRVTHYDMKLADGTILENVAAEDIQVTNASLAEAHGGSGLRDDDEEEGAEGAGEGEEETNEGKLPPGLADYVKGKKDKDDDDSDDDSDDKDDDDDDKGPDEVFNSRRGKLLERLIKDWATK